MIEDELQYEVTKIDKPDVILDSNGLHWTENSWGNTICEFKSISSAMECTFEGQQNSYPYFGFKTENSYNGGTLLINMKVLNPDLNINILSIDTAENYNIIYTFKATTEYTDYPIQIPSFKKYATYKYAIQEVSQQNNTYYIRKIVYYPPYIPLTENKSSYYFKSNKMYYCDSENFSNDTCEEIDNAPGFYVNSGYEEDKEVDEQTAVKYVKCQINDVFKCEKLSIQEVSKCSIGLVYMDDTSAKLCVDDDKSHSIDIFSENVTVDYFIPAKIFDNKYNGKDNEYHILQSSFNAAKIKTEFNDDDRHYKYTIVNNYEILDDDPNICVRKEIDDNENGLLEFERDENDNTYIKKTDST